jgi:septal ring factor EnvC (AmiA/AmiB activator)
MICLRLESSVILPPSSPDVKDERIQLLTTQITTAYQTIGLNDRKLEDVKQDLDEARLTLEHLVSKLGEANDESSSLQKGVSFLEGQLAQEKRNHGDVLELNRENEELQNELARAKECS